MISLNLFFIWSSDKYSLALFNLNFYFLFFKTLYFIDYIYSLCILTILNILQFLFIRRIVIQREMTDQTLFQHIRKLVKEQKEQQTLNTKQKDFAMSYCNTEMSKKKKCKYKQTDRLDNIFKDFRSVQSYVNIMDIINKLPIELNRPAIIEKTQEIQTVKEIVPKSLQIKIREELGPILQIKYKQQSAQRQSYIQVLKNNMDFTNTVTSYDEVMSKEINKMNQVEQRQTLQLIDILRKDKKRKMRHFNQMKFDEDMQNLNKIPQKVQNSKLFHKVSSYLHMILQQEHKQKWQSQKNKQFREHCKRQNIHKRIRIPSLIRTSSNLSFKNTFNSNFYKSQMKTRANLQAMKTTTAIVMSQDIKKTQSVQELPELKSNNKKSRPDISGSRIGVQSQELLMRESMSNLKTFNILARQSSLKQNFTFRKRCIKAGLISKINNFVQSVNNEQKKNIEASKKYNSAFERLEQQIETSYGKFQKQEIARDEDIDMMKKYLDNAIRKGRRDIHRHKHSHL